MGQTFTFTVFCSYVAILVSKGIPIVVGLITLFKLFSKLEDSDNLQIYKCLPHLVVILACISIASMSWSSILGLSVVCATMVVMNKLKS